MQRIGIAAGIAAALAARQNVTPRALDVRQVQAILAQSGALRDADRPRAALPEKTAGELISDLATESAPPAVWQLSFQHADAAPALRESAQSGPPAQRFWSSVALAMARDQAAVPELVAAVKERRDEHLETLRAAPRWMSAIVLLGRVGDPAAVPALVGVLETSRPRSRRSSRRSGPWAASATPPPRRPCGSSSSGRTLTPRASSSSAWATPPSRPRTPAGNSTWPPPRPSDAWQAEAAPVRSIAGSTWTTTAPTSAATPAA